jgi:RNA polymerase sigma factor (sigma-70 family)
MEHNREDLKQLILSFKETRNQDTFSQIIVHIDKLIAYTVRMVSGRWRGKLVCSDVKDLYNAAVLGVYRGIERIKPETESYKVPIWLVAYMRSEIRRLITREYRWSKAKLNSEIFHLALGTYSDQEMIEDMEFEDIRKLLFNMVVTDIISPQEYSVITWIYFDRMKKKDVAAKLGIKAHTLYIKEKRLLNRLRHQFRIRDICL